ncbi:MAG: 4-hydroxythreonine-4-phosphate dehydrogenase PdxA, partial [Clostridiaceae bacterium]|nr:4-hydroxythreonine-4-phosphate dehydrogenase PdxA [Clostridiaceae bacterium]
MGNGLPVLAITMGDPSGIGPEITAKAFNEKSIYDICKPVVIGDASVMKQAIQIAKVPLKVRAIENVGQAEFVHGIMDVIDLKNVDISKLEYGKVQSMSGNAAFQAVKKAIELAINNE